MQMERAGEVMKGKKGQKKPPVEREHGKERVDDSGSFACAYTAVTGRFTVVVKLQKLLIEKKYVTPELEM